MTNLEVSKKHLIYHQKIHLLDKNGRALTPMLLHESVELAFIVGIENFFEKIVRYTVLNSIILILMMIGTDVSSYWVFIHHNNLCKDEINKDRVILLVRAIY